MDYSELDDRLRELRPRLHRYVARMTGSTVDGEDVVQDAMVKATIALADSPEIDNLERWLFRIAHNAAIDFLRRRARAEAGRSDEEPDMLADDETPVSDPEVVAASLRTFMRLPAAQRAVVILMDVLEYRLSEICVIVGMSLPAVKSALHRGRARLRELAREFEAQPDPVFTDVELSRVRRYAERFNANDFEAIRSMLADEVKLDLVNKTRWAGKAQVATYFSNYSRIADWRLVPGLVEGRLAILVHDLDETKHEPAYFVFLEWENGRVAAIRDFRYARYAAQGAELSILE